jgi:hypothetical protein
MEIRPMQIRWERVVLAGATAAILVSVLLFLVIAMYAVVLSVQARGAPDQAQIGRFGNQMGTWLAPALLALLTIGAAAWVTRSVQAGVQLHGLLVGLIAASPRPVTEPCKRDVDGRRFS